MYRVTPILVVVLCGVLLWLSFEYVDGGVWQEHNMVGLAIVVPSLMLWTLARYQLGSAFTTRAEARQLVTRGLYTKIRHPIYISSQNYYRSESFYSSDAPGLLCCFFSVSRFRCAALGGRTGFSERPLAVSTRFIGSGRGSDFSGFGGFLVAFP